jgi:imidazolonepropionase-like amidohydrolase
MPFALAKTLPVQEAWRTDVTIIPEEASPVTSYALVGGRVLDVTTGGSIEDSTVLVDGQRLAAVGSSAEVAVPPGTPTIDARGCWIVPGFMDMHAHVASSDAGPIEFFLANGVTTVRDTGGNTAKLRLLRDAVTCGRTLGPRIFIAGELLDGMPPVWPDHTLVIDTPERARAVVRHLGLQGVDFLKVYEHVTEEALAAVVDAATEVGLPVTGHVPRKLSMRKVTDLGMSGLEHTIIRPRDFLSEEEALQFDKLPAPEYRARLWDLIDMQAPWVGELITHLADKHVYLDPTLIVAEVVGSEGIDEQRDHPDNRYLPPSVRDRLLKAIPRPPSYVPPTQRSASEKAEALGKRYEFAVRCAESGVTVVAGTDTGALGIGMMLPGFSVHNELVLLRRAGLSGLAAVQAATINAARVIKQEESLGSLEAGKVADVVVCRVDPTTSQVRPDNIELVIHKGQRHKPDDLLARAQ